jgi:hypothetical protein
MVVYLFFIQGPLVPEEFIPIHYMIFFIQGPLVFLFLFRVHSSVTAQNFGYDQFPTAVNGWETICPIPNIASPLQPEEQGPPT